MPVWKPIVGKSFSPDQFNAYCSTLQWTSWRPSFPVLHNTAVPTLAQRPNGFTAQSMQDFVSYYRDEQHWSAGPHLFIDDKAIWVFTPLTTAGVHSPSWNNKSLGIEMLGDYQTEVFDSGRGLNVRHNAEAALATLCSVLGWSADLIHFHKEDPLTTHKCPGKNVIKAEVLSEVSALLLASHQGEHMSSPMKSLTAPKKGLKTVQRSVVAPQKSLTASSKKPAPRKRTAKTSKKS